MDIFAHSFNLTDTKQLFDRIWCSTGSHEDVTFDGRGRVAFDSIKGKEPPLTAFVAVEDTQNAIEVNVQASVIRIFLESAFLGELKVTKNKSERKNLTELFLSSGKLPTMLETRLKKSLWVNFNFSRKSFKKRLANLFQPRG